MFYQSYHHDPTYSLASSSPRLDHTPTLRRPLRGVRRLQHVGGWSEGCSSLPGEHCHAAGYYQEYGQR